MNKQWYMAVMLGVAATLGGVRGDDSTLPSTGTGGTTPTVTKPDDDATVEAPETEATKTTTDATKAAQLATQFGVPQQTILDMRQTDHMGWGEILISLQLAENLVKTSTTTPPLTLSAALQQVLALRSQGMGWGQIARKFGTTVGALKHEPFVNPSGVSAPMAMVERPVMLEKPVKPDKLDRPSRPDIPVKPDRPDRPDKPGHDR